MSKGGKLKQNAWTEAKVFDALRHVFPSPAHTRIPSVRNGTGYARKRTRTADGLVFSTWPSRGLWMAGIEIKVSRSDWKKELADAAKSDEIQQYCHHWYVAAPVGVVPINEVPKAWGVIEVSGTTADIVKAAPPLEAKAPDFLLLCAIFRAMEGKIVCAGVVEDRVREQVDAALEAKQNVDAYEFKNLKEVVAEFSATSGVNLNAGTWHAGNIGKAVKFVQEHGAENILSRMRRDAEHVKKMAEEMLAKLNGDAPFDEDDA